MSLRNSLARLGIITATTIAGMVAGVNLSEVWLGVRKWFGVSSKIPVSVSLNATELNDAELLKCIANKGICDIPVGVHIDLDNYTGPIKWGGMGGASVGFFSGVAFVCYDIYKQRNLKERSLYINDEEENLLAEKTKQRQSNNY